MLWRWATAYEDLQCFVSPQTLQGCPSPILLTSKKQLDLLFCAYKVNQIQSKRYHNLSWHTVFRLLTTLRKILSKPNDAMPTMMKFDVVYKELSKSMMQLSSDKLAEMSYNALRNIQVQWKNWTSSPFYIRTGLPDWLHNHLGESTHPSSPPFPLAKSHPQVLAIQ